MRNKVKQMIEAGEHPLGTFFQLGNQTAIECMAYGGLDYVILDTEHGPYDVETSLNLIRAAKAAGLTPLARVKDSSRASILKMLDAGAMGIVIPNVRSIDEAREIVKWGKYFPTGERGIAPTPGTHYWTDDYAAAGLDNYMQVSNAQTMLIPQCETLGCLDDIDEIVALDGIDGIFVGPFDLSGALGRPGDFANPAHIEAIAKVQQLCRDQGKSSFIYGTTPQDAANRLAQGFDSVTYSMDALMLIDAVKQTVSQLRMDS
ncbi:aldolase/citrate lyase family protein [Propionimicrobium sp. PCR01-08-3]|uniref:HpcH/HpaI aldolase family protein n=1 Tax=Propionimicrobium sp. PCR01-08-3 TaxID=3052086 RepID=UPI00255CF03D|nr:aldolase/citrate lyase family protein [Propionimicrobium sp. PCR01-08-3]WIY82262.1 aldolase/citrate lyase family protein [Propionimicrobium sp. PCR01-08-3]